MSRATRGGAEQSFFKTVIPQTTPRLEAREGCVQRPSQIDQVVYEHMMRLISCHYEGVIPATTLLRSAPAAISYDNLSDAGIR